MRSNRKINHCSGVLCALSGAIGAWSSPVLAQTSADAGGASESTIADIVVTAQRRAQRLQDVPISVNAITGDMASAAGITGTTSVQTAVPSLNVSQSANAALPYLRGIGSFAGDPNAESSVAIYVDGVYQVSTNANFLEFNNIERIEVLKGPQGTLFGRNSTGGVIQVITRNPSQEAKADFSVGLANYDTVRTDAYVSGGLSDNLAGNISMMYRHRNDGWGTNLTTGRDTPGAENFDVRGKLLFTPGDATEILLSAFYSRNENGGISAQPPAGAMTQAGEGYPGRYNVWSNLEDLSIVKSRGASLTIDHDFGSIRAKSITAYQKTTGLWAVDLDLSADIVTQALTDQRGRMVTQELHLLSAADSRLQWLVGGFFFDYKAGNHPTAVTGSAFAPLPGIDLYGETKTRSVSVFAQATYPVVEGTNLTVGARYTWDRVRSLGATTIHDTDIIILPATGVARRNRLSYEKPTWRIALDHKFSRDIMGYVSWNRGTKSGSIPTGTLAILQNPFQPEKLDAFEAGLKTELLDRRLRLNLAGFYYDYKNIQFQKIDTSTGGSAVFNGPSAKIYGAEIEIEARPTRNLTLMANGGWLHGRLGGFPGAPNSCRSTVTGLTGGGGFFCNGPDGLPDPANLIPYNADGNHTPFSPSFTGNIGVSYTIPSDIGEFTFAANSYYNSGYYAEVDNRLKVDDYVLVNGSVTWKNPGENLSVRLWAKNITKTYYYAFLQANSGSADLAAGNEPRTYGITLGYKFR